ncbi:AAA family ATPase [Bittarella massiliensis (ex Durand et al. 2017)]|uniref:AAA family ATPase n=1 Tax=Bittarella massiliensis (ex Durand et al. 2017) TaxID=1720313 RepID=UPI001AA10AD1|nr:ATP-binding protein [Bittarella massiliensis (ex Durand et al. 2017)]MBO1680105.1 ATP-binding protein [Bittarella massiliensis (ex Durand et al. 2017)]
MERRAAGVVYLLCGKTGSGKSTFARAWQAERGAALLSVDELMLALFPEYLGEAHRAVWERCRAYLLEKAVEIALAGADVLLDFGFWRAAERAETRARFAGAGVPVKLILFRAPADLRARRLAGRNAGARGREYRIDPEMQALFDSRFEPLAEGEADWVICPGDKLPDCTE